MNDEDELAIQRMDIYELMQLVDSTELLEHWRRGERSGQLLLRNPPLPIQDPAAAIDRS